MKPAVLPPRFSAQLFFGCLIAVLAAGCLGERPQGQSPPQTGRPAVVEAAAQAPPATVTATSTGQVVFLPAIGVAGTAEAPAPGLEITPTLIPVDPHVELNVSALTLAVGQTLTVTAHVVDIGLPYFQILAQDTSAPQGVPLAQVTYENALTLLTGQVAGLQLISAHGNMTEAQFVLSGLAPGPVEIWVIATGEIHYGYPGPAMWGGGGSEKVTIQVTP